MPLKGYKQTEEHKRKRLKNLKGNQYAKGYQWTKEQKENLSRVGENTPAYIDGRWIKQYYCKDCGSEIHSGNQGNKRCKSCSNRININKSWKNPKFRKLKSIQAKKQWESGIMDGVFDSPTKPEKNIMKILEKLEIDYIFQFRPENYSKVYDFYIPNINLLIEFDGIYWHSRQGMKERDEEKTKYADNNGYRLLRINENNLDDFKDLISKNLEVCEL